jgi:hypothetical protein
MKPISSLLNGGTKKNPEYSVHFSDGITLFMATRNDKLEYVSMLSTGLDSYYLKHMKWPTGKNLQTRIKLAEQYITKNKKNNRYRKKFKDEHSE